MEQGQRRQSTIHCPCAIYISLKGALYIHADMQSINRLKVIVQTQLLRMNNRRHYLHTARYFLAAVLYEDRIGDLDLFGKFPA